MRALVAFLAFVVSLLVTAPVVFFAVIFLAGPHGGALPTWLHPVVVILGLLCVVGIPIACARWVWRRFARQ